MMHELCNKRSCPESKDPLFELSGSSLEFDFWLWFEILVGFLL